PERSVTSVVVYCLRKPRRRRVEANDSQSQIRGRDKSVLDDISPLPGTVGLRTVLRYAPFLEERSAKHADARRNCDRLLTGSCTVGAWLAQCGFWRKVGEMQKQMVRVRYKYLTRLALPRGLHRLSIINGLGESGTIGCSMMFQGIFR